jgi:hypothetical protein
MVKVITDEERKEFMMKGFPDKNRNDLGSVITQNNKSKDQEEFFVEKILDIPVKRGKEEFLVKWFGYPDDHNSWEPIENLSGVDACDFQLHQLLQAKTFCTFHNFNKPCFIDEEAMRIKDRVTKATSSNVKTNNTAHHYCYYCLSQNDNICCFSVSL